MTTYPSELIGMTRRRRALETAVLTVLTWLVASRFGVDELFNLHALNSVATAAVLGLLLGALGFARMVRVLAAAVVLLLLIVAYTPIIDRPARQLVRSDPIPSDTADAVVVLSAGVTDDGLLSQPGADRLFSGIEMLRRGAGRVLVLSRVFTVVGRDTVPSDGDQRRILALAGIRELPIVLGPVGTTRIEALRTRETAAQRHWKRVVVVTSPFHTRRACAAFEGVGLAVTCVPSIDRSFAAGAPRGSGERIRALGEWLYETLGWWKYRWEGWVKDSGTGDRGQGTGKNL